MNLIICKDYDELSKKAADIFLELVKENPKCTLGLATGSTPIGMYKELINAYKEGKVDFKDVTTFNLDEYYPISKDNDQSYDYFMNENLFSKINVKKENIHILNGMAQDAKKECEDYDKMIEANGGIDIQLLGIGQNGHIAFNEPDDKLYSATHVTGLTQNTIEANSRFFEKIEDVPTKALTMGIGSILKSRKIVILINGNKKSQALKELLSGMIDTHNPSTLLNVHPDVTIICDEEAYQGM